MKTARDRALDVLWRFVGGSYSDLLELVRGDSTKARHARKLLSEIERGIEEATREDVAAARKEGYDRGYRHGRAGV